MLIIFSQPISLLIISILPARGEMQKPHPSLCPSALPHFSRNHLNASSTCIGNLISCTEGTSTECPVFALPTVSSSFLELPHPLHHFLSRELPLLFQGRPAGDIACEGCFPLTQNSEWTVFLQHLKNVPLLSALRGF